MQTPLFRKQIFLPQDHGAWVYILSPLLIGLLAGREFNYASFNLASTLSLSMLAVLPRLIFIPFLLQWLETLWGITHPAIGWKPARIGIRQLIVSVLWTILFVVFWR